MLALHLSHSLYDLMAPFGKKMGQDMMKAVHKELSNGQYVIDEPTPCVCLQNYESRI